MLDLWLGYGYIVYMDKVRDINKEVKMNEPIKARVVFRKFPKGDIIALFPEMEESTKTIQSYQHIGQHSTAHKDLLTDLELATPKEYAPLKKELESIGYEPVIKEITIKEAFEAIKVYRDSLKEAEQDVSRLEQEVEQLEEENNDRIEELENELDEYGDLPELKTLADSNRFQELIKQF